MAKRFLLYVPEGRATEPAAGSCIVDCWWIVHPQFGLAFYEWGAGEPSPQCNASRALVEHMLRKGRMHEGHVAKLVPVVFLAHALRERALLREAR